MASSTVEERLQKINGLNSFLKSVEERLKEITAELNWSYDKLKEDRDSSLVTCSVNPDHRVKASRIKEHEEKCQWLKDGYHEKDAPFSDYSGYGSCVVYTPELQKTVIQNACSSGTNSEGHNQTRNVPQTSARYDQEFSRAEKLALYNYVISNTKSPKVCSDFSSLVFKEEKMEEKVLTPLEIAAAERDAKRRRASYRNKVHTNRKTQTEILREVIESQMDVLKEEVLSSKDSKKVSSDKSNYHSRDAMTYGKSRNSREDRGHHMHDRWHRKNRTESINEDRLNRKYEHGYKDKNYSSEGSKHKPRRDTRDPKHEKRKKHKRSRSRSREKTKLKKFDSHSDHYVPWKSSSGP